MRLTDALLGEHGTFNTLFETVEEMGSIGGDLAKIESATAVLTAEVDSHAVLEEELLFPLLQPHLGTSPLIDEMLAEHNEIRMGLERMEDARGYQRSRQSGQGYGGRGPSAL